MTSRAAATHDDEIRLLLESGPEEGSDGIAVDNDTAVNDRSLDERSAPTLFEQGDHVISVSHRRYERPVIEARQQAHGMHGNDLSGRTLDEGCCPREGTCGVFRAIDADDDATRRAHSCLPINGRRGCMTEVPSRA